MSSKGIAISVRNLSKSYTIAHNAAKHSTMGEALMHRLKNPMQRPEKETFWALQDVSFDIHKGDVVGIIGRNGAGKSTLLKLLSRITEPTHGRAVMNGRVGSLLEVGTGFHPELTGRENIYMNGAILGMAKREITRQFDAIVEFAGVEQFLDTPVKRYSSGMYVRLAFAVAAHLNPEILIVDEVLAVGDAQFQKKCLGKIREVADEDGRTVLFVSHNMAAIRTLCNRGVLLKNGRVSSDADVDSVIDLYMNSGGKSEACVRWDEKDAPKSPEIVFELAYIVNGSGTLADTIDRKECFSVVLEYRVLQPIAGLVIGVMMENQEGTVICGSTDAITENTPTRLPGRYVSRCTFPASVLNSGMYSFCFGADAARQGRQLVRTLYCLDFAIEDLTGHGAFLGRLPGVLRPNLTWDVQEKTDRHSTDVRLFSDFVHAEVDGERTA